jgi:hypothetical protein
VNTRTPRSSSRRCAHRGPTPLPNASSAPSPRAPRPHPDHQPAPRHGRPSPVRAPLQQSPAAPRPRPDRSPASTPPQHNNREIHKRPLGRQTRRTVPQVRAGRIGFAQFRAPTGHCFDQRVMTPSPKLLSATGQPQGLLADKGDDLSGYLAYMDQQLVYRLVGVHIQLGTEIDQRTR